ncbi:hypothetical protein EZS27_016532 [termite gut metagenome]|uniref:Uncharacterized protein n=1 Tax=termite gut metagenome TaxID=433724 RepID=A0A5J4RMW9_9ZZZZ
MNNFIQNYEKIVEILQQTESTMNFLNQKRQPKLSDLELIAIDLTTEYMGMILNISYSGCYLILCPNR